MLSDAVVTHHTPVSFPETTTVMRAAARFVHYQKETCKTKTKQNKRMEKGEKGKAEHAPIIQKGGSSLGPLLRAVPYVHRAAVSYVTLGTDFVVGFFVLFFFGVTPFNIDKN